MEVGDRRQAARAVQHDNHCVIPGRLHAVGHFAIIKDVADVAQALGPAAAVLERVDLHNHFDVVALRDAVGQIQGAKRSVQ